MNIYIYMVFQGKNTIYKQQERDLSRLSVNLCAHFESSDSFFFPAVAVTRLMFTNDNRCDFFYTVGARSAFYF